MSSLPDECRNIIADISVRTTIRVKPYLGQARQTGEYPGGNSPSIDVGNGIRYSFLTASSRPSARKAGIIYPPGGMSSRQRLASSV